MTLKANAFPLQLEDQMKIFLCLPNLLGLDLIALESFPGLQLASWTSQCQEADSGQKS
jgi:hypothetical protein